MDLFSIEPQLDTTEPEQHIAKGLRWEDSPFQPGLALREDTVVTLGLPVSTKRAVNAAMAALIANLLELPTRGAEWLFYSRDTNHYCGLTRYVPKFYRREIVIEAVAALVSAGLLDHRQTRPSPNAAYRSRVRPTEALRTRMAALSNAPTAYAASEVIVLRRADGRPFAYPETRSSNAMRQDVVAQNALLGGLDVTLVHDDAHYDAQGFLVVKGRQCRRLNPARNSYYRVFNERFDRGGRWYGPWWQSLPASIRSGIRINGECTCEPDIQGCHMRLLCARAGVELGEGDPYDGLGPPRKEIKLAINIMLNASSWRSARGALIEKLAGQYGPSVGTQVDLLRAAVEKRFPAISPYWNSGYGLHLQNIDAKICSEIQCQLRGDGIPCLSVHDSFIVPKSAEGQTLALMHQVFERACAKLRAQR